MKNLVKALISVGSSASLNDQHQSVIKLYQELSRTTFIFSLARSFILEKVSGSYGIKICRIVYREVFNFRLVNICKGLSGHSPDSCSRVRIYLIYPMLS